MPLYQNSPLAATSLLIEGVNSYLFGTYNYRQADTLMRVSAVALASNVGTLTVTIIAGEVPQVGWYISAGQTVSSSGGFNVKRALITAVSINNLTGQGTVSYAVTGANLGLTADFGTAIAEVPEIAETLQAGASVAVAVAMPHEDQDRTITTSVLFPTIPTAATVVLQEAARNIDSEFTTLGNASVVAGGAYTTGPTGQFAATRGNYYRFLVSGITGTGTIVAKLG